MRDTTFWQAITESDYAIPEAFTPEELIPELLVMLESPDPKLRDGFGYMILAHWLYRRQVSDEIMRSMIAELRGKLTHHIGEQDTDTVFVRSFAAEILASLFSQDNKQAYLEAPDVHTMLDHAITYLHDEQDLRGYVPLKGWAHSCAHTADLLLILARNRRVDENGLVRILDAIADKFTRQTGYLYVHGEDQRMARAAREVFLRDLLDEIEIIAWLDRLAAVVELDDGSGDFNPLIHSAYWNTKNLLQAAYFEVLNAQSPPVLEDVIRTGIAARLKRFAH